MGSARPPAAVPGLAAREADRYTWACRPVYQDRDDTDTAGQRGLDLQAHEIVGVVQAPPTVITQRETP
jgi:hypothetical protein